MFQKVFLNPSSLPRLIPVAKKKFNWRNLKLGKKALIARFFLREVPVKRQKAADASLHKAPVASLRKAPVDLKLPAKKMVDKSQVAS